MNSNEIMLLIGDGDVNSKGIQNILVGQGSHVNIWLLLNKIKVFTLIAFQFLNLTFCNSLSTLEVMNAKK